MPKNEILSKLQLFKTTISILINVSFSPLGHLEAFFMLNGEEESEDNHSCFPTEESLEMVRQQKHRIFPFSCFLPAPQPLPGFLKLIIMCEKSAGKVL